MGRSRARGTPRPLKRTIFFSLFVAGNAKTLKVCNSELTVHLLLDCLPGYTFNITKGICGRVTACPGSESSLAESCKKDWVSESVFGHLSPDNRARIHGTLVSLVSIFLCTFFTSKVLLKWIRSSKPAFFNLSEVTASFEELDLFCITLTLIKCKVHMYICLTIFERAKRASQK